MPAVRLHLGKLFIAVCVTLCIGLQMVEATGRWDRTLQDTQDEAAIVAIVLCIGAAIIVARASRPHLTLSAISTVPLLARVAQAVPSHPPRPRASWASPPLPLRI